MLQLCWIQKRYVFLLSENYRIHLRVSKHSPSRHAHLKPTSTTQDYSGLVLPNFQTKKRIVKWYQSNKHTFKTYWLWWQLFFIILFRTFVAYLTVPIVDQFYGPSSFMFYPNKYHPSHITRGKFLVRFVPFHQYYL